MMTAYQNVSENHQFLHQPCWGQQGGEGEFGFPDFSVVIFYIKFFYFFYRSGPEAIEEGTGSDVGVRGQKSFRRAQA